MKKPRQACAAAVLSSTIAVVGGWDGTRQLDDAELFDPVLNSWMDLPSMCHQRYGCGLVNTDGKLWAAGGHSSDGLSRSVETFNLQDSVGFSVPAS